MKHFYSFFNLNFQSCHLTRVCLLVFVLLLNACANTNSNSTSSGYEDTSAPASETRKRAGIRLELASAYFEQGKNNVALEEINQAIFIDSSFTEAYVLKGLIYFRLGDNRSALENYQKALSIFPNNGSALHNIGWIHCINEKYPESINYFRRALSSPGYRDAATSWLTLGVCQLRAGQKLDAEKSLLKSFELDPSSPMAGYNLAQILFDKGEYDRARFYVTRLNNNAELANAQSLWLGARIERRAGKIDAARRLQMQIQQKFPNSAQAEKLNRGVFDE
jgi:type IV pilus assembly protein PilF